MVAIATKTHGRCCICEKTRPLTDGVCRACEKWTAAVDALADVPSDDARWDAVLRDAESMEP